MAFDFGETAEKNDRGLAYANRFRDWLVRRDKLRGDSSAANWVKHFSRIERLVGVDRMEAVIDFVGANTGRSDFPNVFSGATFQKALNVILLKYSKQGKLCKALATSPGIDAQEIADDLSAAYGFQFDRIEFASVIQFDADRVFVLRNRWLIRANEILQTRDISDFIAYVDAELFDSHRRGIGTIGTWLARNHYRLKYSLDRCLWDVNDSDWRSSVEKLCRAYGGSSHHLELLLDVIDAKE